MRDACSTSAFLEKRSSLLIHVAKSADTLFSPGPTNLAPGRFGQIIQFRAAHCPPKSSLPRRALRQSSSAVPNAKRWSYVGLAEMESQLQTETILLRV